MLAACKRLVAILLVAALAIDLAAAQTPPVAGSKGKKPKKNWAAQVTAVDASGRGSQFTAPYSDYDRDQYENLDYDDPGGARADIESVAGGVDGDFVYFDVQLAEDWSSASQAIRVGIEIEVNQSGRGDYFVALNMLSEFAGNENWQDAGAVASYALHTDGNNDVGGSNPDAVDANPGDGYESGLGRASEVVYARVIGNGSFEVAIKRDAVALDQAYSFAFRVWTQQSGSNLQAALLTLHDHLPPMDIRNIDSWPVADTATWPRVLDVDGDEVDIAITQQVDQPYSREGDTVVFTTTATHGAGVTAAEDLGVEFALPAGLSAVSVDPGSGQWNDRNNTWTLDQLAPGAQASFTVTATIDAGQKGRTIRADATLEHLDQDDVDASNNIGRSTVYVVGHDGSIAFVGDANGAPLGSPRPGEPLFVQVADPDLALDSQRLDTATASIVSQHTGDRVDLVLVETAPASGVFGATAATEVDVNADSNDNVLQVSIDDHLTAIYVDVLDSGFNSNVSRTDTLRYAQSAPLITLVSHSDKARAEPGEVITYQIDFFNAGAGAAQSLVIEDLVPTHTVYVAGSMRTGAYAGGYANALALTDAEDGVEGAVNGASVGGHFDGHKISVSIATVDASDGTTGGGSDSGSVYFRVRVQ